MTSTQRSHRETPFAARFARDCKSDVIYSVAGEVGLDVNAMREMSYRQIEAYCEGVDLRWDRVQTLLSWVIASVNNVHLGRGHKVQPKHYHKPRSRADADEVAAEEKIEADVGAVAAALDARRASEPEPIFRSEKERKAYARAKVRRMRDEQRARVAAHAAQQRAIALRREAREYWQTDEGAEVERTLREMFG